MPIHRKTPGACWARCGHPPNRGGGQGLGIVRGCRDRRGEYRRMGWRGSGWQTCEGPLPSLPAGRVPAARSIMRYRRLGSSDLEVSEISLGSWLTFAGGVGLEQTRACTDGAFEAGMNVFDNAELDGRGAVSAAEGQLLDGRP